MSKNFKTQHGKGLFVEGKSLEEIKELQKQGIVKYKEEDNDDGDDEDGELQYERTWTRSEARMWLSQNDFDTDDYTEMPNWHSFTQTDPNKYAGEIITETSPADFDEEDGVHFILGTWEGEDGEILTEVQSCRFYHGEADKAGEEPDNE